MSVVSLLSRLKSSGVSVRLVEDKLKINVPKGKLAPELLNELKQSREQIIEFLRDILKKDEYTPIKPVEKKEYYELSSAQKRLYILQQMQLNNTAYNMPQTILLPDEFDLGKMERVFLRLIERHESLRTSFLMIDEAPVQRVHDAKELEFSIEYYDLAAADCLMPAAFIRSFDLSYAPLLRVGVIRIGAVPHLLLIDMHHIISDGISQEILKKEFAALYAGEELPTLRLQYKDFSEWVKSSRQQELIKQQETYWVNLFADEIPVLSLPFDYPRPRVQSFEGNALNFELSTEHSEALTNLAMRTGTTLYMVLLAIYNILLSKISGQEDIVVGTPIAGRRYVGLEKIIGMFVNTLAMRNYPQGEKTFADFLEEIKKRTLAAFENQEYQFEELVEQVTVNRDASRNPLFDVLLSLPNVGDQNSDIPDTPGAQTAGSKTNPASPHDMENGMKNSTSKFDITLSLIGGRERLFCSLQYCTKLFKKETIERFIRYFKTILSLVTRKPEVELREIEVMPEEEKKQILIDFNDTRGEYPQDKTIHQLFKEQVEKTPDYIAVIGKGQGCMDAWMHENISITFRKLNEKSGRLAELLREKGVLADDIVAIKMHRSIEMIIGIMGILKAGCAYLPIDPDYPPARIDYMLKDSGAKMLVTSNNLEAPGFPLLPATGHRQPATSLAYVIYTSGSTGNPRGVMVEHRHVANLVFGLHRSIYSRYRDNLKVVLVSPYVFDASVKQIFAALLLGHTLYIVPEESRLDGEALKRYYSRYCIDISDGTPTHLRLMKEDNLYEFSGLHVKHFIIGGEELPQPVLEDFFNRFAGPKPQITNVYGPTECCVDSTWFEISERNIGEIQNIPIGKPMPNYRIYIMNQWEQLQPIGVPGELCIAGGGVGRGYLNQPELTAEKFISICYRSYKSYRTYIYKTGDLARWLVDGNIEFLGRIDHQVKIRGFRIEPGEIENQLLKIEGISEAIIIHGKDTTDQGYLCAYIVPKPGMETNPGDIKNALAQVLPAYMIPAYVMRVDNIPLTPNGKVDRRALPAVEPGLGTTNIYVAPTNEKEEKMVEIWAEILGIERETIGVKDDFFEHGGHSLKATILTAKIHKAFNVRIPLGEIFKTPTVEGICSLISVAEWAREQDMKGNVNIEDDEEEVIL
jgi:amino acid adenylation domain-containing protein